MQPLTLSQRPPRLLLPTDPVLWLSLAGLWLAAPLLCAQAGITIDGGGLQAGLVMAFVVAAILARNLIRDADSVAFLLESLGCLLAFPIVFAPVAYLATRSPFPAADDLLRAMDAALGVDAASWRTFVLNRPVLLWANMLIYSSWIPQVVIAAFVLPTIGDGRRCLWMFRTSVLVLAGTFLLCFLLPAVGTVPQQESWFADWQALRHLQVPFVTDSLHIQPIVSFPSFHAASAVLLAHAFRGLGKLSWAAYVLNAAMAVSAIAGGCHYLVDILAGAILAAACIAVTQPGSYRRPMWLRIFASTVPARQGAPSPGRCRAP